MLLDFNKDIDNALLDTNLLLLFKDGSINSGIRVKVDWVKYRGTKNEIRGFDYVFIPIGVCASYDGEPYFNEEPIAYIKLEDIKY